LFFFFVFQIFVVDVVVFLRFVFDKSEWKIFVLEDIVEIDTGLDVAFIVTVFGGGGGGGGGEGNFGAATEIE
jgi:hypothetical protein